MQVNGLNTQIASVARQDQRSTASASKAPVEEPKKFGEFFVTPFLKFDSEAATVLFQVRDRETGDVERQFPAESVVNQYRSDREAEFAALQEKLLNAGKPAAEDSGEDVSAPTVSSTSGSGTSEAAASQPRDARPAAPETSASQAPAQSAADAEPRVDLSA